MKCDHRPIALTPIMLGLILAWLTNFRVFAAEPPAGLVLYYSFDQAGINGKVADKSSLHNDGRATGAKWIAAGKQGGAMEFAATNDCIIVTNHGSLNPKQLTLAVWFKTAKADPVTRRIIDKRAVRGYALSIAGETKRAKACGRLAFTINGRYVCLSDNILTDGTWHQGTAVFDGKELSLYVDGTLQKASIPCPEEMAANLDDLTIGVNGSNPEVPEQPHSFDGVLDEIMIFNRALAPDEVKGLVSAVDPSLGKPKFTKQQVAGRLRELKLLYEEGLLTEKFYTKKVAECEATVEAYQATATTNSPAKPAP